MNCRHKDWNNKPILNINKSFIALFKYKLIVGVPQTVRRRKSVSLQIKMGKNAWYYSSMSGEFPCENYLQFWLNLIEIIETIVYRLSFEW